METGIWSCLTGQADPNCGTEGPRLLCGDGDCSMAPVARVLGACARTLHTSLGSAPTGSSALRS